MPAAGGNFGIFVRPPQAGKNPGPEGIRSEGIRSGFLPPSLSGQIGDAVPVYDLAHPYASVRLVPLVGRASISAVCCCGRTDRRRGSGEGIVAG